MELNLEQENIQPSLAVVTQSQIRKISNQD